jgi:hypothetical protein
MQPPVGVTAAMIVSMTRRTGSGLPGQFVERCIETGTDRIEVS